MARNALRETTRPAASYSITSTTSSVVSASTITLQGRWEQAPGQKEKKEAPHSEFREGGGDFERYWNRGRCSAEHAARAR